MVVSGLLFASLATLPSAWACEGMSDCQCKQAKQAEQLGQSEPFNPTHCAKRSELIGANCSYTTGMMAQRVLEQGTPWTFTGSLTTSENALESHVAAPFTVGPNQDIYIVANSILEDLTQKEAESKRVTLEGKMLKVEGTSYFVATRFISVSV
jgi:hypothetical protein